MDKILVLQDFHLQKKKKKTIFVYTLTFSEFSRLCQGFDQVKPFSAASMVSWLLPEENSSHGVGH